MNFELFIVFAVITMGALMMHTEMSLATAIAFSGVYGMFLIFLNQIRDPQ
jgi:hydrogenase/urease accessory protein HupE